MSVQTMTTAKSFADLYAEEAAQLPGAALPWLKQQREAAVARLLDLGLPTARMEQWRYTPALANRLGSIALSSLSSGAAEPASLLPTASQRIAVAQGSVLTDRNRLASSSELRLRTLDQLLEDDPDAAARLVGIDGASAFAALNLALLQDGLLIEAGPADNQQIIEVAYSGCDGLANLRSLISLEAGADVVLLERFYGETGLANQVTAVDVGPGARLTHLVVLEEGAAATHLGELSVSLARDAGYRGYLLFSGAGLARREVTIDLAEPGAEAVLDGAYLLDGKAHGDLTSHIRHHAADTTSKETVKGVLGGQSRQVFRGKITVEAGAARADGRMANKTLLLSDQAEIDSKPELMIYHDEVQCAHGATSGKLDEQALFYLRSRGLPQPIARKLLMRSFLEETLERLPAGEAQDLVSTTLDRRLEEIAQ